MTQNEKQLWVTLAHVKPETYVARTYCGENFEKLEGFFQDQEFPDTASAISYFDHFLQFEQPAEFKDPGLAEAKLIEDRANFGIKKGQSFHVDFVCHENIKEAPLGLRKKLFESREEANTEYTIPNVKYEGATHFYVGNNPCSGMVDPFKEVCKTAVFECYGLHRNFLVVFHSEAEGINYIKRQDMSVKQVHRCLEDSYEIAKILQAQGKLPECFDNVYNDGLTEKVFAVFVNGSHLYFSAGSDTNKPREELIAESYMRSIADYPDAVIQVHEGVVGNKKLEGKDLISTLYKRAVKDKIVETAKNLDPGMTENLEYLYSSGSTAFFLGMFSGKVYVISKESFYLLEEHSFRKGPAEYAFLLGKRDGIVHYSVIQEKYDDLPHEKGEIPSTFINTMTNDQLEKSRELLTSGEGAMSHEQSAFRQIPTVFEETFFFPYKAMKVSGTVEDLVDFLGEQYIEQLCALIPVIVKTKFVRVSAEHSYETSVFLRRAITYAAAKHLIKIPDELRGIDFKDLLIQQLTADGDIYFSLNGTRFCLNGGSAKFCRVKLSRWLKAKSIIDKPKYETQTEKFEAESRDKALPVCKGISMSEPSSLEAKTIDSELSTGEYGEAYVCDEDRDEDSIDTVIVKKTGTSMGKTDPADVDKALSSAGMVSVSKTELLKNASIEHDCGAHENLYYKTSMNKEFVAKFKALSKALNEADFYWHAEWDNERSVFKFVDKYGAEVFLSEDGEALAESLALNPAEMVIFYGVLSGESNPNLNLHHIWGLEDGFKDFNRVVSILEKPHNSCFLFVGSEVLLSTKDKDADTIQVEKTSLLKYYVAKYYLSRDLKGNCSHIITQAHECFDEDRSMQNFCGVDNPVVDPLPAEFPEKALKRIVPHIETNLLMNVFRSPKIDGYSDMVFRSSLGGSKATSIYYKDIPDSLVKTLGFTCATMESSDPLYCALPMLSGTPRHAPAVPMKDDLYVNYLRQTLEAMVSSKESPFKSFEKIQNLAKTVYDKIDGGAGLLSIGYLRQLFNENHITDSGSTALIRHSAFQENPYSSFSMSEKLYQLIIIEERGENEAARHIAAHIACGVDFKEYRQILCELLLTLGYSAGRNFSQRLFELRTHRQGSPQPGENLWSSFCVPSWELLEEADQDELKNAFCHHAWMADLSPTKKDFLEFFGDESIALDFYDLWCNDYEDKEFFVERCWIPTEHQLAECVKPEARRRLVIKAAKAMKKTPYAPGDFESVLRLRGGKESLMFLAEMHCAYDLLTQGKKELSNITAIHINIDQYMREGDECIVDIQYMYPDSQDIYIVLLSFAQFEELVKLQGTEWSGRVSYSLGELASGDVNLNLYAKGKFYNRDLVQLLSKYWKNEYDNPRRNPGKQTCSFEEFERLRIGQRLGDHDKERQLWRGLCFMHEYNFIHSGGPLWMNSKCVSEALSVTEATHCNHDYHIIEAEFLPSERLFMLEEDEHRRDGIISLAVNALNAKGSNLLDKTKEIWSEGFREFLIEKAELYKHLVKSATDLVYPCKIAEGLLPRNLEEKCGIQLRLESMMHREDSELDREECKAREVWADKEEAPDYAETNNGEDAMFEEKAESIRKITNELIDKKVIGTLVDGAIEKEVGKFPTKEEFAKRIEAMRLRHEAEHSLAEVNYKIIKEIGKESFYKLVAEIAKEREGKDEEGLYSYLRSPKQRIAGMLLDGLRENREAALDKVIVKVAKHVLVPMPESFKKNMEAEPIRWDLENHLRENEYIGNEEHITNAQFLKYIIAGGVDILSSPSMKQFCHEYLDEQQFNRDMDLRRILLDADCKKLGLTEMSDEEFEALKDRYRAKEEKPQEEGEDKITPLAAKVKNDCLEEDYAAPVATNYKGETVIEHTVQEMKAILARLDNGEEVIPQEKMPANPGKAMYYRVTYHENSMSPKGMAVYYVGIDRWVMTEFDGITSAPQGEPLTGSDVVNIQAHNAKVLEKAEASGHINDGDDGTTVEVNIGKAADEAVDEAKKKLRTLKMVASYTKVDDELTVSFVQEEATEDTPVVIPTGWRPKSIEITGTMCVLVFEKMPYDLCWIYDDKHLEGKDWQAYRRLCVYNDNVVCFDFTPVDYDGNISERDNSKHNYRAFECGHSQTCPICEDNENQDGCYVVKVNQYDPVITHPVRYSVLTENSFQGDHYYRTFAICKHLNQIAETEENYDHYRYMENPYLARKTVAENIVALEQKDLLMPTHIGDYDQLTDVNFFASMMAESVRDDFARFLRSTNVGQATAGAETEAREDDVNALIEMLGKSFYDDLTCDPTFYDKSRDEWSALTGAVRYFYNKLNDSELTNMAKLRALRKATTTDTVKEALAVLALFERTKAVIFSNYINQQNSKKESE